MNDVTRREFLRYTVAGAAAVSVGVLLASCGVKPKVEPPTTPTTPATPPKPPTPSSTTPAPGPSTITPAGGAAQTPKDPKNLTELEKLHWPQFEVPADLKKGQKATVTVKIAVLPHPMLADHWIEWAELSMDGKVVKRFELKPGDKPEAKFEITPETAGKHTLKAQINCNKHGLWENTKDIEVK
jgi:superoxide reductase